MDHRAGMSKNGSEVEFSNRHFSATVIILLLSIKAYGPVSKKEEVGDGEWK